MAGDDLGEPLNILFLDAVDLPAPLVLDRREVLVELQGTVAELVVEEHASLVVGDGLGLPEHPQDDEVEVGELTIGACVATTPNSLPLKPAEIHNLLGVSRDDRTIYFTRTRDEADIWMLTLDEKPQ